MKKVSFREALAQIVREDPRYDEQAYVFLREALDFTIHRLEKPTEGPGRHVSGQELLDGVRAYALQEYGPMAYRVLTTWGVESCRDLGEVVFNLVEKGILGKTENDSRADFEAGYSFEEAFRRPFRATTLTSTPAHRLTESDSLNS